MKLAEFFTTIGPFLEGRAPYDEARTRLYGDVGGDDARRLAIYGHFCRVHRFEVLDGVYPHCRAAITKRGGDAAWDDLVESYFREHPMRHFELNENGAAFVEFLGGPDVLPSLPPWPQWLVELADFEWWEWRTQSALDATDASDAQEGPLRIASTVEVRPYSWDFPSWLDRDDDDGEPPEAPPARPTVVMFWRDADLDLCRAVVAPAELAVLKLVSESRALDAKTARALGTTAKVLRAARDRLLAAGVLVGG